MDEREVSPRAKKLWSYRGLPDVSRTPGAPAETETRDFSSLLRLYEMHLAHMRMNPEQITSVRCSLHIFRDYLEAIGVERVQDVTSELVEGFALYTYTAETKDRRPYSPQTIVQWFVALKNLFRWFVARGFVLADPTVKLELPHRPKTIPRDLPSAEEVEKLLAMPNTASPEGFRDRAMIELLYATGLRSSEIVGLDVADFNAEAKTIMVRQGKPKKDRILPVLACISDLLRDYIAGPRAKLIEKNPDQTALFPGQWGERLGRKSFATLVSEYGERAGIEKPITPMAIRHTVATHLLAAGVSIRHIQSLLGHKSVETTTIYTKVTPIDLQDQLRKFHPRQKERRRSRDERSSKGN